MRDVVTEVVNRANQRGGRMLSVVDLIERQTLSLDRASWRLRRILAKFNRPVDKPGLQLPERRLGMGIPDIGMRVVQKQNFPDQRQVGHEPLEKILPHGCQSLVDG